MQFESWPDDVMLYQPEEMEQALLYQYADCLSVRAFLKFSGLKFGLRSTTNAEFMSPSGRVPFIHSRSQNIVVAEIDPIIEFARNRQSSLSDGLSEADLADMQAHMAVVKNKLYFAELFACWLHEPTFREILEDVKDCCKILSLRLGDDVEKPYFFGASPTELDALAFGHLYTLLTTELIDIDLASIVRQHSNLVAFLQRIEKSHFGAEPRRKDR